MSEKRSDMANRPMVPNFKVPRLSNYRNSDGSRIGMPAPPQMDFEGEILSNLPPVTASGGTSGFFRFLADQGQAPDLDDAPMQRQAGPGGSYRCDQCGRTERHGNGDAENVGLCTPCYDAAGEENMHSDYGHGPGNYDPNCSICREEQASQPQDYYPPPNNNALARRQAYKNPTYLPPAAEERFSVTDRYDDRGTPGRGDAMEDKYQHDPKRAAARGRADILIARAEQAARAGRPEMAERLIAEAEACMQGNNGIYARPIEAGRRQAFTSDWDDEKNICPDCKGKGCETCNGTGKSMQAPSDLDDDATVESAFTGYDDDAGAGPVTPKPPKPPKPSEGIYAGRRQAEIGWTIPGKPGLAICFKCHHKHMRDNPSGDEQQGTFPAGETCALCGGELAPGGNTSSRRQAAWNEPYANVSTGYAAYGSGADDALDFGD